MKLLFDFLPIAIFFGIYKWSGDLILATGILIPV
ncbi:MAG: septation protein A, partial [Gammaproteobacteria bacterium]|nr:septation protein A [Gammaproteobacteria bacterium]